MPRPNRIKKIFRENSGLVLNVWCIRQEISLALQSLRDSVFALTENKNVLTNEITQIWNSPGDV